MKDYICKKLSIVDTIDTSTKSSINEENRQNALSCINSIKSNIINLLFEFNVYTDEIELLNENIQYIINEFLKVYNINTIKHTEICSLLNFDLYKLLYDALLYNTYEVDIDSLYPENKAFSFNIKLANLINKNLALNPFEFKSIKFKNYFVDKFYLMFVEQLYESNISFEKNIINNNKSNFTLIGNLQYLGLRKGLDIYSFTILQDDNNNIYNNLNISIDNKDKENIKNNIFINTFASLSFYNRVNHNELILIKDKIIAEVFEIKKDINLKLVIPYLDLMNIEALNIKKTSETNNIIVKFHVFSNTSIYNKTFNGLCEFTCCKYSKNNINAIKAKFISNGFDNIIDNSNLENTEISYKNNQEIINNLVISNNNLEYSSNLYEYTKLFPVDCYNNYIKNGLNFNKNLNSSQKQAVYNSLNNYISLIIGPPGTGKTTTAVEIINQWLNLKKIINSDLKILVCTESNTAINKLFEELIKADINAVRYGVSSKLVNQKQYSVDKDATNLLFSKYGIFNSNKANKDKNSYYVDIKNEIKKYNVVCCTLYTGNSEIIKSMDFDKVLIDECSQATELNTILALNNFNYVNNDNNYNTNKSNVLYRNNQLVMIGDYNQLPPFVLSKEAMDKGYNVSLFERLIKIVKVDSVLLDVQYRMHPSICNFSNNMFYNNKILNDNSTLNINKFPGFSWPSKSKNYVFFDTCSLMSDNYNLKNYFDFSDIADTSSTNNNKKEDTIYNSLEKYNNDSIYFTNIDQNNLYYNYYIENINSNNNNKSNINSNIISSNYNLNTTTNINNSNANTEYKIENNYFNKSLLNFNNETFANNSYYNIEECNIILAILKNEYLEGINPDNIGVITPYEGQKSKIKSLIDKRISEVFNKCDLNNDVDRMLNFEKFKDFYNSIEVNTIDGYQGMEKDLIILSLVRSNNNRQIGFLKDYRRLNVSLTRAKKGLIIIGDSNTLIKDKIYYELIKLAVIDNCLAIK